MAEATISKKKVVKKAAPKAAKASKKVSDDSFAVLATGGKQYVVSTGKRIKIEKLPGDHKVGDTLFFDSVLLSSTADGIALGAPFVKGASISATLKAINRNKKVIIIKYKQKSRYFKKNGHRQPYFEIEIDSIK